MATNTRLHMTFFKVLSIVVFVAALNPDSVHSESVRQCVKDSTVLYLLVLGPFPDPQADPGPGWDAAPAFIPAARLAVEQINNRSDILTDYQLQLFEGDSGCNLEDRAFLSFINNTFYPCRGKTLVGIVGPGCSAATLALAPLTVRDEFNILQMSIATTPLINGTIREHHNTFRTVTSSLKFIDAFEEIIIEQKWNRMAALYDNLREFHVATYNEFRNRIRSLNPQTFHSSGVEEQLLPGALSDLVRTRIRIIFVFAGRGIARQVLCAAFHTKMIFPSYQFFFTDRVLDDFIMEDVPSFKLGPEVVTCTSQQMSQALNGVILSINQFRRQDQDSNNTAARLSYTEYERLYYEKLDDYLEEINLTRSDFAATALNYFNAYYDATWALALSLNNSVEELASRGYNLSYHYRYSRPSTKEVGDVVRSKLINLTFEGMSGTIMFDEERHEVSSIDIDLYQINYDEEKGMAVQYKAGVFEPLNISENTQLVDDAFETVLVQIPLGVSIFFVAVTVIMAVIAIFLQIAIVYYADRRSVKASSPHLNHLIFSGCYLCLLAIFIFISQEVFAKNLATNHVLYGVSCSMSFWTTSISFSLIFGTVVGKTWRIYRIFTHFSQERVKFVSDELLITFVLILILFDTIILCVWNSVNPWYLLERFEINDEQKLLTRYTCTCDNLIVWAAVILGLKGLIAAIAVYLSILTSKVHRKEYKTTQNISIFIYSLIIIYGLGITVVIFVNAKIPVLSFVVMNFMFISTVAMTCTCLIVPPLLPVKNFWGSKVLAKSHTLKKDLTLTFIGGTNNNTSALRNRKLPDTTNQSRSFSLSPLITSPSH